MSSKERVRTTFTGGVPDRVPINYTANAGIHAKLLKHFGLRENEEKKLLDILGVDFRGGMPRYAGPRLHPEVEGRRVDAQFGIRTRWIEHETGGYWDFCDFPLASADAEVIAAWPMPSPDDFDYDTLDERLSLNGDYAVAVGHAGIGDNINMTGMLRGMEQVLIDLITDDEAGLLLIDRRMEIMLAVLERTMEKAKGKADFLWLGEDLGTQNSPMMSLTLFRRHIRPRLQRYVDLAKAYDLPVMIHTCGSSSWAYVDFIDMGINVVDTLQPEAANMSPQYLKEHFGDRLAFHGCISTAGPVAYGTVEDVERDVRDTLEIMMPGGGYAFAPTHALQDNSPVENVVAMYEAAHKYGAYR